MEDTGALDEINWEPFDRLIEAISPFCDQIDKERKEVRGLIRKENIHRAKILNYHLVLENMIDRVLTANISNYNPMNSKQGFVKKVSLLPRTKKVYSLFLDGVLIINRIRNKFAHNLDADVTEEDIQSLRPFIEKIQKYITTKKERLTPIEIVDKFVTATCTVFIFYTPELKEKYASLIKNYGQLGKSIEKYFEGKNSLDSLFP